MCNPPGGWLYLKFATKAKGWLYPAPEAFPDVASESGIPLAFLPAEVPNMAKRDKFQFLTDEIGLRLALAQSRLDAAKGGGKAKLAGEIEGLQFAMDTINKVFDRRTKTLVCPSGHKFEVGLFKSIKEGIPCPECGTPAFKAVGKAKPTKPPTPAGPTTAEIEDAALKRDEQRKAGRNSRPARRKRS